MNSHRLPFRALVCIVLLATLLVACGSEEGQPARVTEAISEMEAPVIDAEKLQSQAAINRFATALKAELTAAMQQGGPVKAIEICNTSAPAVAKKVSVAAGLELGRVSLRYRSPDNRPLDWQVPVLESFDERQASGADPNSLDWSETTTTDGEPVYRYMKAIPTAGLCLQCHGKNIAPQVADAISTLYPQDKATGYSEGEIRGAFVVTRNQPQ